MVSDEGDDAWLDNPTPLPGDDRSTAIVISSLVAGCLETAIKHELVDNKALFNSFFKGSGPLASFSAKINMAVLLGLFDETSGKVLHTIRRIRNSFAHDAYPLDFKSQRITALCQNLMGVTDFRFTLDNLRAEYSDKNTFGAAQTLEEVTLSFAISDDSARTRFLGTAAFYLAVMEIWEFAHRLDQNSALLPSLDKSEQPPPPASQIGNRIPRKRVRRRRSSPR